MGRRFATLDVFTRRPLAGNPLAVVLDGEGLSADRMQAITREFNLSETVFVLPPEESRHRARLRIFTPARELPFAGHPTVGTAVLLALEDGGGKPGAMAFGLEESVGTVACAVEVADTGGGYARFRVPRLPSVWGEGKDAVEAAWALGLDPLDIGFERHRPSRHSAGIAFDFVPVASLEALGRIRPSAEAFARVFGDSDHPAIYAYARVPGVAQGYRARMLAPGLGIAEDPATGAAAAAFAGALMQFEPLGTGEHAIAVEQGVEMGRASEIALQLVIREGALNSIEIGGGAVVVARGELFL